MKLTDNFQMSEFDSKDGAMMPFSIRTTVAVLAHQLQVIRDEIGVPITINSGYRSPSHNAAVGGAKNSYHVKGMAADLVTSLPPQKLAETIKKLMDEGKIKKGGIKAYNTFVHYDIRGRYATW